MKHKAVLVTGATSGLGEATAEALTQQGADVIIASRSEQKCATTAERLCGDRGKPNGRCCATDLSVQAGVHELVDTLKRELPRLDVLVNNAGRVKPRPSSAPRAISLAQTALVAA